MHTIDMGERGRSMILWNGMLAQAFAGRDCNVQTSALLPQTSCLVVRCPSTRRTRLPDTVVRTCHHLCRMSAAVCQILRSHKIRRPALRDFGKYYCLGIREEVALHVVAQQLLGRTSIRNSFRGKSKSNHRERRSRLLLRHRNIAHELERRHQTPWLACGSPYDGTRAHQIKSICEFRLVLTRWRSISLLFREITCRFCHGFCGFVLQHGDEFSTKAAPWIFNQRENQS